MTKWNIKSGITGKEYSKKKKYLLPIKEWLIPILGLTLAFLGIMIAIIGNENAERISKQEQKIKGFDLLLSNSYKTLDKLNSEIDVLNKQLKLNEITQKEANRNSFTALKA